MTHTAAAEVETRVTEVERRVHVAARTAGKLARHTMQEAMTAAEVVRGSMKEAIRAVARATRNIAREAVEAWQTVMPAAATPLKRPLRKAGARVAA
jgi:hypothetical protein